MMNVRGIGQCDQHIAVEQMDSHASSSSALVSAGVIGRAERTTGYPVCGCTVRAGGSSSATFERRPRRMGLAMSWLRFRPVCWAIALAIRCRFSARSMVVRIAASGCQISLFRETTWLKKQKPAFAGFCSIADPSLCSG